LVYHVADTTAFSNDLTNGLSILTSQGGERVRVDLGKGAIIDATGAPSRLVSNRLDIITSNGVIHGIDKVLIPQVILDAL